MLFATFAAIISTPTSFRRSKILLFYLKPFVSYTFPISTASYLSDLLLIIPHTDLISL